MKFLDALPLLLGCFLIVLPANAVRGQSPDILIGLDADMTAGSARAGEAIRRGAQIAIDEINAAGGVLGRPLALQVRDHRGNPARGIANMQAFAEQPDLVAVLGGLHTPVAMQELAVIHANEILFLDPWAAGTGIIDNGYQPNFAFRVSVRDEYAGGFLVDSASSGGFQRIGLLLEKTLWGQSNFDAMTRALQSRRLLPAGVEWFVWGTKDMKRHVKALRDAGAEVILFVGNAPEGLALVRSLADLPETERLPVISHWGITGGDFAAQAGESLAKVDLVFLQTFSFLRPRFPARAAPVIDAYLQRFDDAQGTSDIFSPVGTAHAYDLVHLLAKAIAEAETIDRAQVRDALENLQNHQGLVLDYAPPFAIARHDALTSEDFTLARFDTMGRILPVDRAWLARSFTRQLYAE